jgi:hypothetical protein
MSRDRRGEPQQPTAGRPATAASPFVGKATLTQSLHEATPVPGRLGAGSTAAAQLPAVQRKLDHRAGYATERHGAHDIASLFGRPPTAGGAPVQRKATSALASLEAEAVPEISGQGMAGAGAPPPHRGQHQAAVQRTPAAANADKGAQPGMWEHTFGEASTPVGKLGRVQAPKGVYLRERPIPGAASSAAPVPFNGLVYVERRTHQDHANARWCYVIATEVGTAGFCEERYLAMDPPEPTATLHRTAPGERLATIAENAYGPATDENNSRLYVQALYLANRDRAGVRLDHIDLSAKDRVLRGEEERRTLEIYKGAKVIAGNSIWIPSKPFIDQLKAAGAVTGGATRITGAWNAAKGAMSGVIDGARYVAGFIVGLLEGAYNAVVDLFKGAVDMVEAALSAVWSLITGNPGRIKEMAGAWVDKMKLAWGHRGELADEFLNKWNAESGWDRGLFQGEVLGWVTMTVLLVLITMGEDAPAALSGIAVRWPQLVKLLRTVDTLGDVTAYVGAAAKAAKIPGKAIRFIAGKFGRAERAGAHVMEDVGKDAGRAGHKADRLTEHAPHDAAETPVPKEHGPEHSPEPSTPASELLKAFRRAKKIKQVEAVSLKRLRIVLGQAGATPGKYKLVRATEQELAAIGGEASGVFGWVARDGANAVARDARGRPIITFTPRGLASLEEAVKTFGHEVQHLKDFAAGVATSSEDFAEEAGEKLWLVVQAMQKR